MGKLYNLSNTLLSDSKLTFTVFDFRYWFLLTKDTARLIVATVSKEGRFDRGKTRDDLDKSFIS